MLAEHEELQEVKTVALQNQIALDLLQGGTCKVIGTECCSYISDAITDVMHMVHDTAQGIKELHNIHWSDMQDLSGLFRSWGAGVLKFLTSRFTFLLVALLLIMCRVFLTRFVCKRASKAVVISLR